MKDTGIGAPHFRTDANCVASKPSAATATSWSSTPPARTRELRDVQRTAQWSPSRTLSVDDKVTAEAAVDALRRMVNTE